MFTVRFPTGILVQYNDANFLYYKKDVMEFYTKKEEDGGRWIASIPYTSGAIVEVIQASRVYNPTDVSVHVGVSEDIKRTIRGSIAALKRLEPKAKAKK